MKFILSLPPTTNHIWRYSGHGVYMTAKAKAWKQEAQYRMKTTNTQELITTPVEVTARFFLKWDRDVDNLKLVLDALQDVVLDNDSQVQALHVFKAKDKKNPRVELEIAELRQ